MTDRLNHVGTPGRGDLPRTMEEIHRQSLDRRGRPVSGPLPRTSDEIVAFTIRHARCRIGHRP